MLLKIGFLRHFENCLTLFFPIAKKCLDATGHTEYSLVGRWIRSGRTGLARVWRPKPTWTRTVSHLNPNRSLPGFLLFFVSIQRHPFLPGRFLLPFLFLSLLFVKRSQIPLALGFRWLVPAILVVERGDLWWRRVAISDTGLVRGGGVLFFAVGRLARWRSVSPAR
jgi:hypothetical protein